MYFGDGIVSQAVSDGNIVFIEYKDVSEDEFTNWRPGGLGWSIRKRNELKCINLIAELTRNGSPSSAQLRNTGLKEVEDLDFFDFNN